jgi:hypothetical protein
MGDLKDAFDENMLEGDYSLKAKIEKERKLFDEGNHSKEKMTIE